ncbi:MAG: hypothetical protein J7L52_07745 [Thermotogae bacterium]|nr:hypothetical protein [Thermotogota bacterium]
MWVRKDYVEAFKKDLKRDLKRRVNAAITDAMVGAGLGWKFGGIHGAITGAEGTIYVLFRFDSTDFDGTYGVHFYIAGMKLFAEQLEYRRLFFKPRIGKV